MAIDLSGIPDVTSNIDFSGIPDASSGVSPSSVPTTKKFNPLLELSRGGAGLRSMIQGRGFTQGAMNPEEVPSFSSLIPPNPASSTPDFDTWRNAALGTIPDLAIDPVNALPLPIGKAIGAGVSRFAKMGNPLAQGIENWATRNIPNLAPNVLEKSVARESTNRLASPIQPLNIEDVLKEIPDAVQSPLASSMNEPVTPNPIPQIGTPPIIEASANPLETFLTQNGQGQFAARDLTKGTKGFVQPNLQELPYEAPIGPARNQGQQEFDFTKGPQLTESPAPQWVKDNYSQQVTQNKIPNHPFVDADLNNPTVVNAIKSDPSLSAAEKDAILNNRVGSSLQDLIPKEPVTLDVPAMKAQVRNLINQESTPEIDAQIADLRAKIADAQAPVFKFENADLAKPVPMPTSLNPRQKAKLDLFQKQLDEFKQLSAKTNLSPLEDIRLEELGKSMSKLKEGLPTEALGKLSPSAQPTALDDIATILTDIHLKGNDPNIIEMNSGAKAPDFEIGPKGREALDRWKKEHLPAILNSVKTQGITIEQALKDAYPQLDPKAISSLVKASDKIGNLNLTQYPSEQKQQLRDLFAGQEEKLVTKPMTDKQITEKANDLTSLPVTENIIRSGEGQTAAEIRRRVMTDIAKLKAVSEDPNLSAQEAVQKMLQLGTQNTKKVKTEIGRALGGMKTPLEAQQEQLTAMRKIVDRLRGDPTLSSAESQALVAKIKSQFPELEKAATPAEIFKFMFRNFITSSPRTLLVNATSGYGNIAVRPLIRSLEITSAKLRSLVSQNPESSTYKEVWEMYKGMYSALKGGKLPESLKAQTFSDKYSVSPLAANAAVAKTQAGKTALDVTNKVVSAPETIMRKTDEHVKNILGMMEKYAAEARGEDVLGDQHVIDRITSAQSRGSFQDEMSAIGRWVAQSRNFFSKQPPTVFNQSMDVLTYAIQPFIQTVDRIIAKAWNTSALGAPTVAAKAASGQYRGAFAKGMMSDKFAGEKFDRDIASAMIGIPLFVWAGSQLAAGNITGSAPADTAGREAFGNAGKTEYSIKVKGRWIPLRDLPEPMSTALQINLALIQGMTDAKGKGKDLAEGAFAVVQKVGNMLGTKQYLGGMNSLLNSMSTKGYDTVNELPLVKKIIPSVAVPSVVKDVGVVKDTLEGKPRVMADTAIEALKRRAGATAGMVPELNTFGEEVTHPMMGQVKDDNAHQLAEKFPPQPVERTRDGVKLSQQEYYDLKKNVGEQRKRIYTELANNKTFMDSPKGAQQLIVEDMVAMADKIGSTPQKIKEIQKDPLYYNRKLRVLLQIDKPGGERHFPYLK